MKKLTIEQRNEQFNKLSAAQKRVAITKDAIKQIQAGIYTMEQMRYVKIINPRDGVDINQKMLLEYPKCKVCAAGGLALSAMRIGNEFEFVDMDVNEVFMALTIQH